MTRDDDRVVEALRAAVAPARVPPGLAERAFQAAMAAGAAPDVFARRFLAIGRRVALVGAIATALVWGGLLLRGPAAADTGGASAQLDPAEAALSLWTGAEVSGGD
jgi:hypothetical protein